MTEPSIPLPTSPYARVRARVASIWADGTDDGINPDWRPAVGEKVTLTPSISSQLLVYDATGPNPIIVTVERVECVVNADGWLAKADGRPIYIAPTDDPLLSVTGWVWTASIKGRSIPFSAPTGGVVDLALFIAAPATGETKLWVEQLVEAGRDVSAAIDAAIDASGSLVGIASVTSDNGDMVVTLSDGETHRFPMPPGTPGPASDLTIGTVTVGEPASASISGTAPDLVLDLVLPPGQPGAPGDSAYLVAVAAGFLGTEAEWLASLKGEDGDTPALPPISWEDDQLRFGDALSPSLTGPVSSLAIGTVTTGTPSASITGTPPSQKLNLVLPPGQPGQPGAPGAVATSATYLIVGPGRPDTPSTTGGTITGSEPVGAEYRSTDGANVGAWVWMKRPTGWVVADGDTGWRILYLNGALQAGYNPSGAQYLTSGRLRLRRTPTDLWVSFDDVQWSGGEVALLGGLHASWQVGGDASTYPGDVYNLAGGPIRLDSQQLTAKATTGRLRDVRVYPANVAWPTTLPGSPS